jgi:hypothetical protein
MKIEILSNAGASYTPAATATTATLLAGVPSPSTFQYSILRWITANCESRQVLLVRQTDRQMRQGRQR